MGDLNSLKRMDLQGCPSSLQSLTLIEPLFQIYSGFEQEIHVGLESEKFPDWIIQSSVESSVDSAEETSAWSSLDLSTTMNLQPNLSHNYLGMILCFKKLRDSQFGNFSVMTSASNKFTDKKFNGSRIVIVPRSIFTVTDADHTMTFTSNACRHWIRLLYKNQDDSTTVNVEDERNNLQQLGQ